MLFNSIDFAIFLPIVFIVYWFLLRGKVKAQNLFLLFASYVFYGWWDWRFLSLIIISSVVDYYAGINIANTENQGRRKFFLILSVIVNIGLLGFFKYFNFFTESFAAVFTFFGISLNSSSLNIVLPVGISFYTFQTMSYTIDIYRKKIDSTKDIIAFFAFVSFFPQLVAGPIERAANLLPQFFKTRMFKYDLASDGLRQILWGLFKKIVVADTCAMHVNEIFANHANYNGSTLLLGAILFAFQIYGDFSGYSDIARGTAQLFGFKLMRNFAYPYFSRDIAEFWRRWHISLSSWFRDYVYIPLGGSRCNLSRKIFNTLIIFTVSGFWHGANWTFILWGVLNALYFIPLMVLKQNRKNLEIVAKDRFFPSLNEIVQMFGTFMIVIISWVFFRARSILDAFDYLRHMFTYKLLSVPDTSAKSAIMLIAILVFSEWCQRDKEHALVINNIKSLPLRWGIYLTLSMLLLLFLGAKQEFIYFQF